MFKAGIGSVMMAHLYIPAIDSTPNTCNFYFKKKCNRFNKDRNWVPGLNFYRCAGNAGCSKSFSQAEKHPYNRLIAGNDMLCLPGDIPAA